MTLLKSIGLMICVPVGSIPTIRWRNIGLTAKEYRILLLLAANKGRVLTYAQIYEQVWGDFTTGNENNTIGFHICNLREKLYRANPDAPFYIRSVREVGYCLDVDEP